MAHHVADPNHRHVRDRRRSDAGLFKWRCHGRNELMRWMTPFVGHRMMLSGAMVAREGGAYVKCTHAIDRPSKAELPGLRN